MSCSCCGNTCYAKAFNASGARIFDANALCATCGAHQLASGPPCSNGCDEPKKRAAFGLGHRKRTAKK